jgi:hypothetical protein
MMRIYAAKGQNLEDTDSSLLDRNLGQNHNIYQYNNMRSVETLLTDRKGELWHYESQQGAFHLT